MTFSNDGIQHSNASACDGDLYIISQQSHFIGTQVLM